MILNSLYALICSFTFGILFNIRGKNLLFASFGGGLAWYFYLLGVHAQSSEVVSLFLTAIIIATYSEIQARILKTPVTTFIICAMIPLVPGGGMYYTMLESIRGNTEIALNLGLKTLLSAGAIAVGIALVSSTAKLFTYFFYSRKQSTILKK